MPNHPITGTPVPTALTEAITELWRIPPPGPDNLLSAPRFVHLRGTCESLYSNAGSRDALGIALSNAVRALGLPCGLVPATPISRCLLRPQPRDWMKPFGERMDCACTFVR
jgi:hypothetical protein